MNGGESPGGAMVVKRKLTFTVMITALLYIGAITCAYADPVSTTPCRNTAGSGSFCITTTELSGIDEIIKGSSGRFILFMSGTNAGAGTLLQFSIFSQNSDIPLVDDTQFTVTDDANGNWTFSTIFFLRCTNDCLIVGPVANSSSPSPAKITALIEGPAPGMGFRRIDVSNTLNVECTTAPEPATILLLGTGLAGVAIKTRNRLKRRKSGEGRK